MSELGLPDHATATSAGTPARRAATTSADVGRAAGRFRGALFISFRLFRSFATAPTTVEMMTIAMMSQKSGPMLPSSSEVRGQRSEVRVDSDL